MVPSWPSTPRNRAGWIVRAFRAVFLGQPGLDGLADLGQKIDALLQTVGRERESDAGFAQLGGIRRIDLFFRFIPGILSLLTVEAGIGGAVIHGQEQGDPRCFQAVRYPPGFGGPGDQPPEVAFGDQAQGLLDLFLVVAGEHHRLFPEKIGCQRFQERVIYGPTNAFPHLARLSLFAR